MNQPAKNLTSPHTWQKPPAHDLPQSKETVIIFGDEHDPTIAATKKRIETLGRHVEVQPRPAHDTGMGICGEHMCSCTEPCKSFHYNSAAK